jgi:hypothetical protein
MTKLIAAGLLAGLVAGILYVAAGSGSFVSLLLFYAAPLPLAIAGFVWFWPASIAALVSGGVVVAYVGDFTLAAIFTLSFSLPVAWFCNQILMSRETAPDNGGSDRVWYPLGNIVASVSLVSAALAMAGIFAVSGSFDAYQAFVREHFQSINEISDLQPDGVQIDIDGYNQFLDQLTYLLPVLLVSGWIMIMLLNLFGGAKIAALSGQFTRPWEDLGQITLSKNYAFAMVPVFAGTFLAGFSGLVSLIVLGALAIAHAVVGLAVVHVVTRGMVMRPAILGVVYGSLVLLGAPALILGGIGLVEPWVRLRDRFGGGGNLPTPGNRTT